MKLLFCTACSDIFALRKEVRSCECGYVKGKYLEDGHKAVVNGNGISLGINNNMLKSAVAHILIGGNPTPQIACWARAHRGKDNPNTEVDFNL